MQGEILSTGGKRLSGLYTSLALAEESFEVGGVVICIGGALSLLTSRLVQVTWRGGTTSEGYAPLTSRAA